MQIRGARSLADVPCWRKLTVRLTTYILTPAGLFLKPKLLETANYLFYFQFIRVTKR
jgi:hypothetical protein